MEGEFKCRCGSKNMYSLQYHYSNPEHYDGISEHRCQDCETRYGRWSGKILKDDEWELRYGGKQ